jgi:hypothetical protein
MRFLLLLTVVAALTGCAQEAQKAAAPLEGDRSAKAPYAAGLEVHLDRAKLARWGIGYDDASRVVEKFLEQQLRFKLSELNSLQLTDISGKAHELREFAIIEVEFDRVPHKEQAK